jgi:hypothetical protein
LRSPIDRFADLGLAPEQLIGIDQEQIAWPGQKKFEKNAGTMPIADPRNPNAKSPAYTRAPLAYSTAALPPL